MINEEKLRARCEAAFASHSITNFKREPRNGSYVEQDIQENWIGYRAAHQQIADDGCVIVPREPTEAMIDAGAWAIDTDLDTPTVYKAMIEAHEASSGGEG